MKSRDIKQRELHLIYPNHYSETILRDAKKQVALVDKLSTFRTRWEVYEHIFQSQECIRAISYSDLKLFISNTGKIDCNTSESRSLVRDMYVVQTVKGVKERKQIHYMY